MKTKLTMKLVKEELRAVGVTISKRDGEYRVNFAVDEAGGPGLEATACYTDDLDDARGTGLAMAKRRDQMTVTLPQGAVPVAEFFAVGPYCWGRGATFAEAIRSCLRYGGKLKAENLTVFAANAAKVITVNDMGSIDWPRGTIVMKLQTAVQS